MRCMYVVGPVVAAALALGARPSPATTTFVDVDFDRSAWEAAAGQVVPEPFDDEIAQADVLEFDSGIVSVASGLNGVANHRVDGTTGRFQGTLRTAGSSAPGYLSFVWTFPEPVTAFGADFFSIGGSRQVSVQGTFDSGLEAFDLRALFVGDGGVDQGFFGLISEEPFTSITLVALGSIDSNDAFTIDDVAIDLPEPGGAALAAGLAVAMLAERRRRRIASAPARCA